MKKVKRLVWQGLNKLHVGGLIQLGLKSALMESGWFRSFHTKQSVDAAGAPLPWCTYPYISFIMPRLEKHWRVFEYGCGNSTRWYADRVGRITAVEHDTRWVQQVRSLLPANASVIQQALESGNDYPQQVHAEGKPYELIIIDGRRRNDCAQEATQALTADGVIVFDNSDRDDYQIAMTHLAAQGFRRLDFWGLSPITSHLNCTSIFYRSPNCLGI